MRSIIAIAWNDIRIELADKSTLLFFVLLPLVFTTIIGLALGNLYGPTTENGDTRYVVAVADEDQSAYSQDLIRLLEDSPVIRPVVDTASAGMKRFTEENLPAFLTIPSGFGEQLSRNEPASLDVLVPTNANVALTVQEAIKSSSRHLDAAVQIADQSVTLANEKRAFESPAAQDEYRQQGYTAALDLVSNPPVTIHTTVSSATQNVIPSGFEQSSPGQLVTWVMTTLLGGSVVFVVERQEGTLRRLLISPNRKATILFGKILGRFGLGILQMVMMITFGALVLNVNWGQSYPALGVMLVAFGLAGTAMGIMLAAFSRTSSQASGFSILFSMLLAALGGAWWPLEVTPIAYQNVVKILPTTWAMKGFTDVIVRGQGIQGILLEAGILVAFAALFFTIGLWKLRYE